MELIFQNWKSVSQKTHSGMWSSGMESCFSEWDFQKKKKYHSKIDAL